MFLIILWQLVTVNRKWVSKSVVPFNTKIFHYKILLTFGEFSNTGLLIYKSNNGKESTPQTNIKIKNITLITFVRKFMTPRQPTSI